MISTKRTIIICLVIAAFLLVGCEAAPVADDSTKKAVSTCEAEEGALMIFYVKGDYLIPIGLSLDSHQNAAKTAVEILFSGVCPDGFGNLLSETDLREFSSDGDTVAVDLSKEFLAGDHERKKEQLIHTLMECSHVEKVDIYVDGNLFDNIIRAPRTINLQNGEIEEKNASNEEYAHKLLTIYYIDAERYLVPITIISDKLSECPTVEEKAKAALDHLAKGLERIEGVDAVIPSSIKTKVEVKENIAYVDVDGKLLVNLALEVDDAKLALESIILTLTSIEGINQVQFYIDGRDYGYIVGNVNISKPLSRPTSFNQIH